MKDSVWWVTGRGSVVKGHGGVARIVAGFDWLLQLDFEEGDGSMGV